jgi:hypothetical protein
VPASQREPYEPPKVKERAPIDDPLVAVANSFTPNDGG